jgi:50S ribosomal protein L16 3-hydroxylase
MRQILHFPDDITADGFLRDYWQRRPLLMRQALPDVQNPLTPEELAGLACEAGIESRLIEEHGEHPWMVRHGPFDEAVFTGLPDSHWTLLVQDVDKHLPAAERLLEAFAFLPRWRMDDLMVSYAPNQGSVGPHLDAYDVFLIQTHGRRRWRISTRPYGEQDLIPDLEIKVLSRFETEQEWLLEPGDVLYLPPGVAHWGIAEGDCMTCSVGFRSPGQQELAAGWLAELLELTDDELRYRDPADLPLHLGGRIPADAVAQVRAMLDSLRQWDDTAMTRWFGRYITEPKPQLTPEPAEEALTLAALEMSLAAGDRLVAHPYARLAYAAEPGKPAMLFADGESFMPAGLPAGLVTLCDRQPAGIEQLPADCHDLLLALYNQGSLVWEHERDALSD